MKKKFLIMIAVITAVISCLWFFLKPAAKDPTLVTLYGNVDIRQFDIGFQVPGQITKMYFEEGDTIREGSLVAEIDAADYKLQEAKSESEVAKAYAAMVQAQSVYDKYTVLYGTGAISKLDFETVENTLKEARSAYNASVTAKDLLASYVVGGEGYQAGRYADRGGEIGFVSAPDRGVRSEPGLAAAQCQAGFVEQGEALVLSQRDVLTPDESSGVVVLQCVVEIDTEVDVAAQFDAAAIYAEQ